MSRGQERLIAPPSRARAGGTAVIVAIVALVSVGPLLPLTVSPWLTAGLFVTGLAVLTGAGALVKCPQAVHAGLFWTLVVVALLLSPVAGLWLFPLAIAIAVYGVLVAVVPKLRASVGWVRRGAFGWDVWLLVLATVVVSSLALVVWYLLTKPDVSEFRARIPGLPVWLLALAGLGFAVLNAMVEEVTYRGVLLEALDAAFGPGAWAVALQAASFGLAHIIGGFPNGWLGVAMAATYGLMLGMIRHRSRGMLAPWSAHVFADVTVFAILILLVR